MTYLYVVAVLCIILGVCLKIRARGYLRDRRKQQVHTHYTRRATDYRAVDEYYEKYKKDAWGDAR